VGGGPPIEGCGPAPGYPSTDACKACTADFCCDESAACAADAGCNALASCVDACGGAESCIATECPGPQPAEKDPPYVALAVCQAKRCASECDAGTTCSGADVSIEPDCDLCTHTQCCEEIDAWGATDSLELDQCVDACTTPECLRDCELAWPAAVDAQNGLLQCIFDDCAAHCSGTTSCGAVTFSPETCSECMIAGCCDLWNACIGDVSCTNFIYGCAYSCESYEECRACAALWPYETVGQGLAALNCQRTTCSGPCPGNDACGGLLVETPPCFACKNRNCCEAGTACGTDPACAGLRACFLSCNGEAACEMDCENQHPAGVATHDAVVACLAMSCAAECAE
jgi:hypothetical protein